LRERDAPALKIKEEAHTVEYMAIKSIGKEQNYLNKNFTYLDKVYKSVY